MSEVLAPVPGIATTRLHLRPIRFDDLDAVYALHSDPRGMRYWSCPPWTQRQQALDWFAQRRHQGDEQVAYPWAVTRRDEDRLIGIYTVFALNREQLRCEIGYSLHPDEWGRGYALEGMRAVLAHAFGPLAMERIEADIDPRNTASCRLVEKLGFQREGLLRERWRVAGEITDTALYGLLRREFSAAAD